MSSSKSPIDQDLIRALAGLLHETDLTELEVEQEGLRVRVSRAAAAVAVAAPAAPVERAAPAEAAPVRSGRDPAGEAGTVKSPMVGTAYLSPEPAPAPMSRSATPSRKARRS